jgi:hypothetical protein
MHAGICTRNSLALLYDSTAMLVCQTVSLI